MDGDAQRIGQLSWMLFRKISDRREDGWEDESAGIDYLLQTRETADMFMTPIP